MEGRRIGALEVSVAGLGCNNFGRRLDKKATREVVAVALDEGVTLFDTAESYGDGRSEEYLGEALKGRRETAVVATKFAWDSAEATTDTADFVVRSAERSLQRLGTDHIDLYYYHRPHTGIRIGSVLEGLNRLTAEGKVLEIGCSNFSAEQLEEAAVVARERGLRPFVVVENEYNLMHREPEEDVLEACERFGLRFVPYFPLASGLLSGKYRRGEPVPGKTRLGATGGEKAEDVIESDKLDAVERLATFAETRGHSLLELALSWLATRPRVACVIAGAMSPQQVRANASAVGAWRLNEEELTELERLLP